MRGGRSALGEQLKPPASGAIAPAEGQLQMRACRSEPTAAEAASVNLELLERGFHLAIWRYILPSHREELRFQFEQLQQGQIWVTDYEVRFFELSRHELIILLIDTKRVQRFVTGLQATMAREVEMGKSYELVVEIAQRIEGVRQRSREKVQKDKRFRYSG
ncbi:uncharacterized protein [Nicotiana tomentosiformis]|uniref:uncharacterized protein n=1 Tax=Nicotiana tomentosiformis TaxID=4098 RepID=UPI00388CEB17